MAEQEHLRKPALVLTDDARAVLERVKTGRPGRLALVIGNGCCDSTAPYLFADYSAGPNELAIGELAGVPVYLDESIDELTQRGILTTEQLQKLRRACEVLKEWRDHHTGRLGRQTICPTM